MKLLLDENLSYRLCRRLLNLFEGVHHVDDFGLDSTDDARIWAFAKAHGYAIVTQDRDFVDRVLVDGAPPHVIWIRIGNAPLRDYEKLLRESREQLARFESMPAATYLSLPTGFEL